MQQVNYSPPAVGLQPTADEDPDKTAGRSVIYWKNEAPRKAPQNGGNMWE